MNIPELKPKSSEQLITQAEELGIENASTLRKQEILFAILKKLQKKRKLLVMFYNCCKMVSIFTSDGKFNYLPGPDDIYVSPS